MFRAVYTLGGNSITTRNLPIVEEEDFEPGDVVAIDNTGAVQEATAANTAVLGYSASTVVNGEAEGVDSRKAVVIPFLEGVVYAAKRADGDGEPDPADIGEDAQLTLSTGTWGISAPGTSGTANTPQVKIVDVDEVRGEWHFVINTAGVAGAYQWYDGDHIDNS